MKNFVSITPEGRFALDGARWFCNSTIYFGHHPGAMRNWFFDDVWPQNQPRLEHDFARMAQSGSDFGWFLAHALEAADVSTDLLNGPELWLRQTWGYSATAAGVAQW